MNDWRPFFLYRGELYQRQGKFEAKKMIGRKITASGHVYKSMFTYGIICYGDNAVIPGEDRSQSDTKR